MAAMQKLLIEKEQKLEALRLQNQVFKENTAKEIKAHLVALDEIDVNHKKSLARVRKRFSDYKQAMSNKAQIHLAKAQV